MAEFLVRIIDGGRNIEDIRVGDLIYAKNADTGETGYKEVTCLFVNEATELVHLEIGDAKIETAPGIPSGWQDTASRQRVN